MSVRVVEEDNNKIIRKLENGNEVHELFENAYSDDALSLEEYSKLGISTGWNYNTLEEELLDYIPERDRLIIEGRTPGTDIKKEIEVGDIIFVTNFISPASSKNKDQGHRFFIVSKVVTEEGKPNKYQGYELQTSESNPRKRANIFNKNRDDYANNIFIKDFSSILYRGPSNVDNKECYIDVEHKCWFDDFGITDTGYWKGNTSYQFRNFIKTCIDNAKNGNIEANKEMQWPIKVKKEP